MKIDLPTIRAILVDFLGDEVKPVASRASVMEQIVGPINVVDQIVDCLERTGRMQEELEYLRINESKLKVDLALQEKKIAAVMGQCRHWVLDTEKCVHCGRKM